VKGFRLRFFVGLALAGGIVNCGDDAGGGGTEPETPRATTVTVSPAALTFTFLGQTLMLTAQVRDQNGLVMTGPVTWSSSNPAVVSVSSTGQVVAVANGSATISAQAGSATGSASLTVAQVATRLLVSSGDVQSGTVGQALSSPVVAMSVDQRGNPVPNASITFTPAANNGSVSPTTVTSDGSAQASTTWTLGTAAGAQHMTGTIAGQGAGAFEFTATGVAAAATTFAKSSGDQQVAPVNSALASPVVVVVRDEFGNGVSGASVTFAVTGGGGSVNPATIATGADGTAQTVWTMGSTVGSGGLSATNAEFPVLAFAAASSVAIADLTLGPVSLTPASPTSLEGITVAASVSNSGSSNTGAQFPVQLLIDDAVVSTQTIGPLAGGGTAVLSFSAGPLSPGGHSFSVVADPDNVIVESDDTNNTAGGAVSVALASTLTAGAPLTNVGATLNVELLYEFELAATDGSIEFVLASTANDDADMYVNYGTRPATRDDYECISGAADSNEACRFNAALPGTYHVLIHAFTTFGSATLSVATGLEILPYNIELRFINSVTTSQNAAFAAAAARLEEILFSDVQDIDFASQIQAAGSCIEGQPAVADVVDDVRIFVDLVTIDGPGGTLGSAGPCVTRTANGLPILGRMQLDTEDLAALEADGELGSVILHEMLHVLGVGTIWNRAGLLSTPSVGNPGVDTHFTGPLAIAAFDAAGGTTYTGGNKVPVENSGSEGSADGHWRESVFSDELMTPFLGGLSQPLSAITVQSLADVRYRVDVSKADAYNRVFTVASPLLVRPRLVDFRNDLYTGPVIVVDAKGQLVKVIRR
jgi:hypothetical protein